MEKFLAMVFVVLLVGFTMLGNFWFTYGVWPRSWWSFAFFVVAGMINAGLMNTLHKKL